MRVKKESKKQHCILCTVGPYQQGKSGLEPARDQNIAEVFTEAHDALTN